jgi:hypothetical protein
MTSPSHQKNNRQAIVVKSVDVVIYLAAIALWLFLLYAFFPSDTVNAVLNTPTASLTGAVIAIFVWIITLWTPAIVWGIRYLLTHDD